MPITYDRRAGQFRGNDGRFVAKAEILRLVDGEAARLEVRLQGHARLLTSNRITVSEFQTRMAEDIKLSHLRMASFGAGGEKQLTPRQFGLVGAELKKQYKFLGNFGQDIAAGRLSEKQILARAKLYGRSPAISFYNSERVARVENGFNQAKRLLDPQAAHCAECITYATGWTDAREVVPPGTNCSCGGRCKCRLLYRRLNEMIAA